VQLDVRLGLPPRVSARQSGEGRGARGEGRGASYAEGPG
jgi:hypothetical protein